MFDNKSILLDIILDDAFDGIMYGLPEESTGCKLKGKVVLNNRAPLSAKHLLFIFIGRVTVACGPPMSSSRPEYSETRTVYRKECLFHNSATSSNKKISAGTHEYYFDLDLPGHLPSSFKGTRGKIEYCCSAFLSRPLFHNDLLIKKTVHIKRCLMDETRATQTHHTTFTEGHLDEKILYQISTPIMTFREGGLVHTELTLKSADSDIVIEDVEYGLKEQVHYRTTGEQTNAIIANVDEDIYPLGKSRVKINQDLNDDDNNNNSVAVNFRLCPWVNCDVDSQLINVKHKLSFTICVSETIDIENENNEERSDRRLSVPYSNRAELQDYERRRATSWMPPARNNKRNSRTFSLSNFVYPQKKTSITKVVKKRLHLEIPIVVTTKSSGAGHQSPPYNFVDRPPSYAIASMVPPPPDYVPDAPSNISELLLSRYLTDEYAAYDEDV